MTFWTKEKIDKVNRSLSKYPGLLSPVECQEILDALTILTTMPMGNYANIIVTVLDDKMVSVVWDGVSDYVRVSKNFLSSKAKTDQEALNLSRARWGLIEVAEDEQSVLYRRTIKNE